MSRVKDNRVSQFPPIQRETWKLSPKNKNSQGNFSETASLKALASKVLQRNPQGNFQETARFHPGKFDTFEGITEGLTICVWSEILQAHFWIVTSDNSAQSLRAQRVAEPIYTIPEIEKLRGANRDELRTIHQVKEVFPASEIESRKKGR